jgi:alkanesulfonate monooxygenase SsuD/methylene tetrahydromethanopterin reductase-like flavin-dependent oxidoreductase (luciferase family)
LFGRGRILDDEQADALLEAGAGDRVDQMMIYSAVGTPTDVGAYLDDFIRHADADELMVVHQSPTTEGRLRSVTLLAEVMQADSPDASPVAASAP